MFTKKDLLILLAVIDSYWKAGGVNSESKAADTIEVRLKISGALEKMQGLAAKPSQVPAGKGKKRRKK